MVNRLNAVGVRSINNVVDITNYVLMEYGHPLHALTMISCRKAELSYEGHPKENVSGPLTDRNGYRQVPISPYVTARNRRLAGIMGGQNSEVSEKTRNILLESAYFSPSGIRRTARRIGLHTEASHRFERGADINILVTALNRAVALMAELAGGSVARGVVDVYPGKAEPVIVCLRQERAHQILGISLSTEEIIQCFHNLEFECEVSENGVLSVTVPSFRVDIEREIDLIEELARLVGYDRVQTTMPTGIFSDRPTLHQRRDESRNSLLRMA
jgi:phenylalanyl-tRNA synthetase beta chain